ncbi:RpiB/LacA/LacB family sugar-phosphate isomerase [Agrilactobacillus yilanensis]|uniref:RpiB/LacA/LacB family sugar-phosphate isomerase n=1 Tax=Agrilactobacillus yilanensis TaxID=2485997 RepID=A0ABW4J602_9LACO|nr:RpiB/LacA/LacB family sugar-phosphate isomerase [Agrilactobacillus yilanensis]
MKIALLNEFSQAPKNGLILQTLKDTVEPLNHQVYNVGMSTPLSTEDVPEAYTKDNPRLTYLHLGIQAALLLNAKAVDFVVAGCGTGQGALMSLNIYPGVVCGYCIEPADAYLYLQINNGNALSIPFAKGFGWGAEINLKNIFQNAFSSPSGLGYPAERKESQNANAAKLMKVKSQVAYPLLQALKNVDQDLVKESLTPNFRACFNAGCQNESIREFVNSFN